MKKDITRNISEIAKLELALSSLQSGKFSMAEYFLLDLKRSKNRKVRAAAHNAEGIIFLSDKKLPEAVAAWNQALKADPNYKAARLNIGFISLKYGDHRTAKKMLSNMQNDWFALTGLMIAERLAGNSSRVQSLCERIDDKKSGYKPARFSCALNLFQGLGKTKEAKSELKKVAKLPGLEDVTEKTFLAVARIEKHEGDIRRKESLAKKKKKPNQPEVKSVKDKK